MGFITYEFLLFFLIFLAVYWLAPGRNWKNLILVAASYLFYGWIVAWHVLVVFLSTLIDYFLALGMARWKPKASLLMWIGVALNIGLLAFVKYYFFFNTALSGWLNGAGLNGDIFLAKILLPLGLSFYALKKIGYLIDVQRGTFQPARDFIAFAAYISFFPQVFSGPIDRPQKLLTQLYEPRVWKPANFTNAWPLLIMGFFKKIVIANTVSVIVSQIFKIDQPSKILLFVGCLGFALQILTDFTSYTDLSRGLAFLLGLETTENFNYPYLSLTPGDFWNRWHISLSSWLRDYIFFPLRRALLKRRNVFPEILIQSIPPLVTMFVSGIWHGIGWLFIIWGLYYGMLIVIYQLIGFRGDWKPSGRIKTVFAWLIMFLLINFGWLIFRAPSVPWLWNALTNTPIYATPKELMVSLSLLGMIGFYASLLIVKFLIDRYGANHTSLQAVYYVFAVLMTIVFINSASPDFIYFQF